MTPRGQRLSNAVLVRVECQVGICPGRRFGSDGRRNTCLQFTRRSFKAQRFSWTLIQAQRDLVEVRL